MDILKEEEEWEFPSAEQQLNWFYYPNTPQNQAHLQEKSTAFRGARKFSRKFPGIIYAPSYQAASIENFALCEYLANHGFVVVSSPSRGTETNFLEGGTVKDMETPARDIEFLLKETFKHDNINQDKIAPREFSFGGLSHV